MDWPSRANARRHKREILCGGISEFWTSWVEPNFHNEWLGEILAAVYNLIALFALAMVLLQHDDKPLSEWNAYITINTVISILSTSTRLSMAWLVQQALGQAKWLHFSQHGPAPLFDLHLFDVSSRGPWGALQMIWSNRSNLATYGALLTIIVLLMDPASQELVVFPSQRLATPHILLNRIQHYDVPANDINGITQLGDSTLQQGVLSGTIQNPLQALVSCKSGDCDTDKFGSLAFCSACQTRFGHRNGSLLISSSNITWQLDEDDFFNKVKIVFSEFPLVAGMHHPIFGFAEAHLSPTDDAISNVVNFTECALTFCSNVYQLVVVHGSQHLTTFNSTNLGTQNLNVSKTSGVPHLKDITVSTRTTTDVLQYFQKSLTSTNSDLRISLVQSNNVTRLMSEISTSMSNALLRESGSWTIPVDGFMYTTHTIIHVRWPWLALPLALLVATFTMLCVIIDRSHRHKDKESHKHETLWKSSILAPLFTKIEGKCPEPSYDDNSVTWLGSLMDMRTRADRISASLEKNECNQWVFRMDNINGFNHPRAETHFRTPHHTAERLRRSG